MQILNRLRILDLRNQYVKRRINNYIPKQITYRKAASYIQDASNCWLYSAFNNLQLNTGIKVVPADIISILNKYNINTRKGWDPVNAGAVICNLYKAQKIRFYSIDVLTNTKLFADMLLKWYSFIYSRDCSEEFLADILDNGRVDKIHSWTTSPHATNLMLDMKQLKEMGTWWAREKANTFVFDNVITFIWCVRAKAIKSEVLFFDYA